jgi:hypothetical protein
MAIEGLSGIDQLPDVNSIFKNFKLSSIYLHYISLCFQYFLKRVFTFLDVKDLGHCRSVSNKWNELSSLIYMRRVIEERVAYIEDLAIAESQSQSSQSQ